MEIDEVCDESAAASWRVIYENDSWDPRLHRYPSQEGDGTRQGDRPVREGTGEPFDSPVWPTMEGQMCTNKLVFIA